MGWLSAYTWLLSGPFGFLLLAFWIWMLVYCVRNDPERQMWLWILIFLNVLGAVIYFIVRVLPRLSVRAPRFLGGGGYRHRIWQAEADARKVGNPYHYIKLGDVLAEAGQPRRAAEAYRHALEKDADDTAALFGLAQAELAEKAYADALPRLSRVLEKDPQFRYGEASLALGVALVGLGRADEAREHLESHLKRWSHPQAVVMLAEVLVGQGRQADARRVLQGLVDDMKYTPGFNYRKNRRWVRRARQLLRSLPV